MEEGLTKPEWKDLTTLNADCSTSKRMGVATGGNEARMKSQRTLSRSVREGRRLIIIGEKNGVDIVPINRKMCVVTTAS
jgi:hypothetical protein